MSVQESDNSKILDKSEAVANSLGNVKVQNVEETNTLEHKDLMDKKIRDQQKINEKNMHYLNILNERLQNQEIKLQNQQQSIEDNRLLEQRLRRYISKQRVEYGKHWQTVYNLKLQILQEIQKELESQQQTNRNLPSTRQFHPQHVPIHQLGAARHQNITPSSYHQQSNPLLRQLLPNRNQASIPVAFARLNSLANLRHQVEADIHVQQQTQHETNEILRSSRELLRVKRQQFRILRQGIEQITGDSTLV